MVELTVQTPLKTYPVYVGTGVISRLPEIIRNKLPKLTKIFIITDEMVGPLYLKMLKDTLSGFTLEQFIVPSGEKAKTFAVYYECLTAALENKLDRHSLILALGGGAVGDLSGFVAATFMRGIPFMQIPTTILAHDSAVGGKVAINHPAGKNMVGAFYQPEAVVYDMQFLTSLSLSERRSGFAEVIKHGLIQDEAFYQWLLENIKSLEQLNEAALIHFLARGIEIKSAIVSQDEKETGVRAYLNFGHTLGHAIEAEMGYGRMTHGEGVTIGMLFALKLSIKYAGLSFDMEPLVQWLKELGYQTEIPGGLAAEKLVRWMKGDKKSVGQQIRMVLLEQIGTPILHEMTEEEILQELAAF
ncbi:3-dehydroquinate synthase [Bacillus benzoevorans]|uniref:3-dehydroquinate synthase n=1 Tax=Bacillus benzoevorans TaxID=1456 RepID=A0A7X0HPQ4_9BACI|nr:3-dehydroquinate synthase [Bacillus benzoevorans]MBB6444697.1 3-dehydroquinate synthase [Bacillus benzoevorans]